MKIIILVFGFLCFGLSAQDNDSALVGFLIGKVSIKASSDTKWKSLKKDDKVNDGDTLMTGNGYDYPHNHDNNFTEAQYLPDKINTTAFYAPGNNIREEEIKKFLKERWKDKYGY